MVQNGWLTLHQRGMVTGNGFLIARNHSSALGMKYSSKRVTDQEEAQKWLTAENVQRMRQKNQEESVCLCVGVLTETWVFSRPGKVT